MLEGHGASVNDVGFSPDGEVLPSCSGGLVERFTVRLWDVETWTEMAMLEGHEGAIGTVAFNPAPGPAYRTPR
ncbi:MAG: hypothetical protein R6X31_12395 [Anaerolineae bacterium]